MVRVVKWITDDDPIEFSAPTPVVACYCGEYVTCWHSENECQECGMLYNMAGQELKPYDEWEE